MSEKEVKVGEAPIADKALNAQAEKPAKDAVKNKEATAEKSVSLKYQAGVYRSDKFLRVIKELTYTHAKDDAGHIQKTYGTWANDKNMIIFSKGAERRLTEEELKLPVIQRLIDTKVIYRVGG